MKIDRVIAFIVAASVAALIIASCSDSGGGGRPLLTECPDTKTITLTVLLYDTEGEINEQYRKLRGSKPGRRVEAFEGKGKDESHRYIFARRPRGRDDTHHFYLLGHELAHSLCGSWHPEGEPN